jgi:hypothetical protein
LPRQGRQATRSRCANIGPSLDTGRAQGQNDVPKTACRVAGFSVIGGKLVEPFCCDINRFPLRNFAQYP